MPTATLKCTGCKERYPREQMLSFPSGKFHDYDCATSYARDKSLNTRVKEQKQKDKKRKQELKTKREWTKDLQVIFNRFIRLRDKDLPCISCGSFPNDDDLLVGSRFDCGHYLSVGSHIELRFEELNCHKQCVKCNRNLSGNVARYRIGLINKIGLNNVEWLEGPHELKGYSIDELREMIAEYKQKIKDLSDD